MGIYVPDEFDFRPGYDIRATLAINGDAAGEARLLLDNATWLYANLNRGVLLEKCEPIGSKPTATASYVDLYWVQARMSEDTPHVTMEIYGTNVKTKLTVYDSAGGAAVAAAIECDAGAATGPASTTTGDLTGRADAWVFLKVEIIYSAAPGNTPELFVLRIVEHPLEDDTSGGAGDLPTA